MGQGENQGTEINRIHGAATCNLVLLTRGNEKTDRAAAEAEVQSGLDALASRATAAERDVAAVRKLYLGGLKQPIVELVQETISEVESYEGDLGTARILLGIGDGVFLDGVKKISEELAALRADALRLAVLLDDFENLDFFSPNEVDVVTRSTIARLLKAAGKTPKHPETRALVGAPIDVGARFRRLIGKYTGQTTILATDGTLFVLKREAGAPWSGWYDRLADVIEAENLLDAGLWKRLPDADAGTTPRTASPDRANCTGDAS